MKINQKTGIDRSRGQHTAQLYSNVNSLLVHICAFVDAAFQQGESVLLIADGSSIEIIERQLADLNHDVAGLRECGRFTWMDAQEALDRITVHGEISETAFIHLAEPLIEKGLSAGSGLAAYGEIVNLLWKAGRAEEADRLEQWWNRLIERYGFSLMCGYHADLFDPTVQTRLDGVCRRHTHLFVAEDGDHLEQAFDAALQQVFPHASVEQMRQSLLQRSRHRAQMPDAQAALMSLGQIDPSCADDVRIRTRELYRRRSR